MAKTVKRIPWVRVFGLALLVALATGAIVNVSLSARASDQRALATKAVDHHRAAADVFEDAKDDVARKESRVASTKNAVAALAADYATHRSYCDIYSDGAVFEDVSWCDISAMDLDKLGDAESAASAATVRLGDSEATYDLALLAVGSSDAAAKKEFASAASARSLATTTLWLSSVVVVILGASFFFAWIAARSAGTPTAQEHFPSETNAGQ